MSGETNGAARGGKRRRVWCETLPLGELADGPALGWLGPRGIDPVVAVRPGDALDDVARVVTRARDAGLAPAVWPMLADVDGRWCGVANASAFAAFAEALLDGLVARRALPSELAVDLEPPIATVRAAFVDDEATSPRSRLVNQVRHAYAPLASRAPLGPSVARLRSLVDFARERGVETWAAVPPPVLFDPPSRCGWQRLLGTPVAGVAWSRVSPMLYTSLLEGWSRRAVDRPGALALLAAGCAATRERFGAAAAASLGCVGTGALEAEPTYRDVAELAADVAVARAAGVEDLALFDLGGVTRRADAPPEAWLDALVETPPAAGLPGLPFSLRAVLGAASALARFSSRPSW